MESKGAAILKINKQMMKTDNIQKLVRTNNVTNVYKNRDCLGQSRIFFFFFFFFFVCQNKLQSAHFFDSRSGNWKHNIFF